MVLQVATTVERIFSNACDTVRNGDARQTAATGERRISNARYAVRNCDARQTAAIVERIVSNARSARDDDFFQRGWNRT